MIVKKEPEIEEIEDLEVAPAVATALIPVATEAGKAIVGRVFAPKKKVVQVPKEEVPMWQKVLPWALGGAGVLLIAYLLLRKK
jgi:hypothetical protein